MSPGDWSGGSGVSARRERRDISAAVLRPLLFRFSLRAAMVSAAWPGERGGLRGAALGLGGDREVQKRGCGARVGRGVPRGARGGLRESGGGSAGGALRGVGRDRRGMWGWGC